MLEQNDATIAIDLLEAQEEKMLNESGAAYLVGIHDSVAGTFIGIHVESNKEVAIRNFRLACQNEGIFSSSPADFSLYVLGRVLLDSGVVYNKQNELLISALDIIGTRQ